MKKWITVICLVLFALLPLTADDGSDGDSVRDVQLETIGAASGSNLFLTYISIGVIADSYQNELYESQKAVSYVNSITAQAGVVKKYLVRLVESGELNENDAVFVKEMATTYELLISEGDAFVKYAQTGDKAFIESFHNYRNSAWAKITRLLGLE